MHADGPRASPATTGPEAALARCLSPAWVIDPARGRVLAANPAGAARLGLRPDAASGTLDAAMPGLVRLRALMHEPMNGGRREPLIFWTAYGAESLLCNVSALADASPPLVLVSIVGAEEEQPAARLPLPPPAKEIALSADDANTMKKIARAIRTGFSKSKTEAPAPERAPSETETPSGAPQIARAPEAATDISKLAHELRTPLSAIVLASEIMKDQRLGELANDRYRSYTNDIHDNARHALEVINRLLAESAPQDAAAPLEAAEIDLNGVAESSVSGMRPLAEKAELKLSQELHARLPHVLADAMSVKQILFNLLANAIKFTKKNGEVRVVTGLGFDRSVFVAVQDTGPGMAPEAIARALDADAPPKLERKEAGGLGIGLPLAASLAKANGARLEIDATLGEGTVVALVFPKDRVARSAKPGDQAATSSN
jgi:two-component system cell cycle sensor histidine kinase PleC